MTTSNNAAVKTVCTKCESCSKVKQRKAKFNELGQLKREIISLPCPCGGKMEFAAGVLAKYEVEAVEATEPVTSEPEAVVSEPEVIAEPEATEPVTSEPEAEPEVSEPEAQPEAESYSPPVVEDAPDSESHAALLLNGAKEAEEFYANNNAEYEESENERIDRELREQEQEEQHREEEEENESVEPVLVHVAATKPKSRKASEPIVPNADLLVQNVHVRVRHSLAADQESRRTGAEFFMTGPDVIRLMGMNRISIPTMAKACSCSESKIRNYRYYGIKTEAEAKVWTETLATVAAAAAVS